MRHAPEVVPAASVYGVCKRIPEVNFVGNPERISVFIVCGMRFLALIRFPKHYKHTASFGPL